MDYKPEKFQVGDLVKLISREEAVRIKLDLNWWSTAIDRFIYDAGLPTLRDELLEVRAIDEKEDITYLNIDKIHKEDSWSGINSCFFTVVVPVRKVRVDKLLDEI